MNHSAGILDFYAEWFFTQDMDSSIEQSNANIRMTGGRGTNNGSIYARVPYHSLRVNVAGATYFFAHGLSDCRTAGGPGPT